MKIITSILVLLLTSSLFSQVKLLEKNEVQLLGEINKQSSDIGIYAVAHLKMRKRNSKKFYEMMIRNNSSGLNSSSKTCSVEFYAEKSEFELIYRTIYKDFSNPADAKTTFKLGNKILKVETSLLHNHILIKLNEKSIKENVLELKLGKCKIYINQSDWKKLFGR